MYVLLVTLACLGCSPPEKSVYNYLLFSPPDAQPGEERWREWQPVITKRLGAKSCRWLMHAHLFPRHPDGYWDMSGWIDETKAAINVRKLPKDATLVLNVEHGRNGQDYWGVITANGMEVHPPGVEHRRELLSWIRQLRPDLKIGFYSVLPPKAESMVNGTVARRERWRGWCRELTPLADDVDFLVPECYPDSDWTLNYTRLYLQRTIMACRDFWPGKPIYPLLWMEHYDLWQQSPNDFTVENHHTRLIPVSWWKMEMETCWRMADGFMLWGCYKVPWNGGPWWRATKEFLNGLRGPKG